MPPAGIDGHAARQRIDVMYGRAVAIIAASHGRSVENCYATYDPEKACGISCDSGTSLDTKQKIAEVEMLTSTPQPDMPFHSSKSQVIPAAVKDAHGRGFSTTARLFSLLGSVVLLVLYVRPPMGSPLLARWALIAGIAWLVFDVVSFAWFIHRRRKLMLEVKARKGRVCTRCLYPLAEAAAEVVCPECGTAQNANGSQAAWGKVEEI